jgi:predicted nuclease with TOPRIM domain
MESISSKTQFIQQLIDDSLKYQLLYKAEQAKISKFETTIKKLYSTIAEKDSDIKKLHSTIAEKDSNIKSLKQKNMKHLMEIGVNVSRYSALTDKYKQLEHEMSELSIKYEELSQILEKAEEIHIQNLRVILNEYFELTKQYEQEKALIDLCN